MDANPYRAPGARIEDNVAPPPVRSNKRRFAGRALVGAGAVVALIAAFGLGTGQGIPRFIYKPDFLFFLFLSGLFAAAALEPIARHRTGVALWLAPFATLLVLVLLAVLSYLVIG